MTVKGWRRKLAPAADREQQRGAGDRPSQCSSSSAAIALGRAFAVRRCAFLLGAPTLSPSATSCDRNQRCAGSRWVRSCQTQNHSPPGTSIGGGSRRSGNSSANGRASTSGMVRIRIAVGDHEGRQQEVRHHRHHAPLEPLRRQRLIDHSGPTSAGRDQQMRQLGVLLERDRFTLQLRMPAPRDADEGLLEQRLLVEPRRKVLGGADPHRQIDRPPAPPRARSDLRSRW